MKHLARFELLIVILCTLAVTLLLFRRTFFDNKTLFPSNLLVTAYSPWKYQPVPEYPNGPPNKPMGFDNIRQAYPDRKLVQDSLKKGTIPLWNPYIYSGAPFMAAGATAVWYPLSWIAALFSTIQGWNFLVVIQPILSIIFMYLFLRSLGFRTPIAAFGSFVYAFSGWMVVYWQEFLVLEHSFLWLPLALYASNRLWKRSDDQLGFFLLLVSLIGSVLGGFLQMSVYVYAVVIAWNIFQYVSLRGQRNSVRALWIITFAFGCSVLVEAVQLIPSIQAFVLSPRGTNDGSFVFKDDLLPLRHLITLLAPDYWGNPATYNYFGGSGFYFEKMIFIGIIPLLFAVYGMIHAKKKTIIFWTVIGLVCFSMAFALPTSWLPYYLKIPILSTSYPTRILAVWVFSFSILACHGLEEFLHSPHCKRMIGILIGSSVLLGIGWIVVLSSWCINVNYQTNAFFCMGKTSVIWDFIGDILLLRSKASLYATVSLRNLIVPTVMVFLGWGIVLISKYFKKFVYIFVCLVTVASSYYFIEKYLYFGDNRFVYPQLPVISQLTQLSGCDRIWGYGNAFIEKNFPEYFRWFSTDGYSNLSSGRYAELLTTIVHNGKLGGIIRRSDTDLNEVSETDPLGSSNPYRLRMMSLFGVKYILESKKGELKDKLTTAERFPRTLFTLAWEDETWRIWRYSQALPRAVFTTNYIVKTAPQDIVSTLYDTNINLSHTVILEKNPNMSQETGNTQSEAVIISYDVNSVTIRTKSNTAGFLLLTDNYYPGWTARVDGKPVEILRADYTLRAVPVSAGSHEVIFQYLPTTVVLGGYITIFGILLSIAVVVYNKIYQRTNQGKNTYNNS